MMILNQNLESVNLSHYLFLRKLGFVYKKCINATEQENDFITRL